MAVCALKRESVLQLVFFLVIGCFDQHTVALQKPVFLLRLIVFLTTFGIRIFFGNQRRFL